MYFRGPAVGLTYCSFYLAFYFTNKYVLSILKFTFPTLFQGWQTLVGGIFLHVCWKLGWVEINFTSRADVVSWLPASAFFVGIIYAGSRALSRLPIPVFLTLHNASEVVTYVVQRIFSREQSSYIRLCSVALLLISAGCLPIHDHQFDADGYFWAAIHLLCSGCYRAFQKSHKSSLLSDLDQQYINYFFRKFQGHHCIQGIMLLITAVLEPCTKAFISRMHKENLTNEQTVQIAGHLVWHHSKPQNTKFLHKNTWNA
ncbi:UDP-N-acetylglucosamine transporter TMEM241 isoform X3 [Eleutherodactylus coqui]|uniref:UDP-N-acetylglucosamine transporter TMEM241 isoform X3 n=1 Tax=Eleutherodactylus coqui TaxID=57060 RepID=UPI003462C96F